MAGAQPVRGPPVEPLLAPLPDDGRQVVEAGAEEVPGVPLHGADDGEVDDQEDGPEGHRRREGRAHREPGAEPSPRDHSSSPRGAPSSVAGSSSSR